MKVELSKTKFTEIAHQFQRIWFFIVQRSKVNTTLFLLQLLNGARVS